MCLGVLLMGQDKDSNRMNRDLKIAEDVIASLFKSESGEGNFYSARPKATYVPDFGVMISISGSSHLYSKNLGKSFSFTWDDGTAPVVIDMEELRDIEVQAEQLALEAEQLARMYEQEGKIQEEKARELERKAREIEKQAHMSEEEKAKMIKKLEEECCDEDVEVDVDMRNNVVVVRSEKDRAKVQSEMKELTKNVMISYLTDYADLIGQLQSNEKIMLTSDLGGNGQGRIFDQGEKNKMSASVDKKTLSSYKSGKMSRDKFINEIVFTEESGSLKSPDLELLSSIFERLYKADLATTYYCHSKIPYERLENFGVIFKLKVYSSTSYGKDNHKITTLGKSGLTQQERDEIVDGMYPQFLKELKENILDYGKTVKSLKEDENMIFQVNLTQCIGCQMPKTVDLTLSQSVLKAYDSGKMKREDALGKIKVKEGR